ncbi:MAG: hypothetical protein RSD40_03810 [Bacilli bacterium]
MKIDIEIINEIIDKEMDYAKNVNPVMALGMSYVKDIINKYNNKLEKECEEK